MSQLTQNIHSDKPSYHIRVFKYPNIYHWWLLRIFTEGKKKTHVSKHFSNIVLSGQFLCEKCQHSLIHHLPANLACIMKHTTQYSSYSLPTSAKTTLTVLYVMNCTHFDGYMVFSVLPNPLPEFPRFLSTVYDNTGSVCAQRLAFTPSTCV